MTERPGKYWICDSCADKRGWICFKTGNTCISGLCNWCESTEEQILTPLRDFVNKDGIRADCEGKIK